MVFLFLIQIITLLEKNIVENNTDYGIILNHSNDNRIIDNEITNNPFGIALSAGTLDRYEIDSNCKYNIISKKNFTNNPGF